MLPTPRSLVRAIGLGLVLGTLGIVASGREAHAAESRTWHYLTTGNGHGFQVFSEEKHRITQFLEHPYRYIAPAKIPALPPEGEGVGRRNLAFDVFFGVKAGGWLSNDTGGEGRSRRMVLRRGVFDKIACPIPNGSSRGSALGKEK